MTSKICIVGLGYIGLPTATVFADAGVDVHGVDISPRAVAAINAGEPHIVEPGLGAVLSRVVKAGKLRASSEPVPADVFIIAVPTPFKGDHEPDLSYIEAASKAVAPHLKPGDLIILESTSPVGATEKMAAWMAAERADLTFPADNGEASDIRVAHCPERVLPGQILREVVENDRVIGGLTPACAKAAAEVYRIIVTGECFLTEARTAEMAKLTENAFRDVNIAFANELSLICDKLGVDVWELIPLANKHPRVNILQPGPGVGGHCIAVDPWFIVDSAPKEARLIRMAREVNDAKPDWVIEQVRAAAAPLRDPTIACFGLAFKPNVDDLRESPSLAIAERLAGAGVGRMIAVEPHIADAPACLAERGVTMSGFEDALEQADIAVLLVDHDAFKGVMPTRLAKKAVIDTRGVWRQPSAAQVR